jgi:hypothetical protein
MAVELGTAADTATLARAASGQPRDSPGRCPIIQNAAPEPSLGVQIEAAGSLLARTAYLSAPMDGANEARTSSGSPWTGRAARPKRPSRPGRNHFRRNPVRSSSASAVRGGFQPGLPPAACWRTRIWISRAKRSRESSPRGQMPIINPTIAVPFGSEPWDLHLLTTNSPRDPASTSRL